MSNGADDASNTVPEPSYSDLREIFRPYAPATQDEAEAIRAAALATAPKPTRRRKASPFVWRRQVFITVPFDRDAEIPF
ncbi:hypothetical protein ACO2RV_17000 [Ancylobacter sp. VNQ12]|uniref:hypothetical protein n=1 Tax=Ancylobacter sp. VNQ12 TaxID=3400920 RepID=UPI003C078B60